MLIHTLKKALTQGSVSLTRHRIDLISRLVCALIQVRLVNMRKLACSLSGRAQIDSHYRRLQRFFSSAVSPSVFTQLIVSKVVRPSQPQLLVMDRTHGRLGRTDQNVLCVGLVYQGSRFRGISVVAKARPLQHLRAQASPDEGIGLP